MSDALKHSAKHSAATTATSGFVDLHSHLLPGIDDGAETVDEAAEMCRRAAADGAVAIVATPHLRHARFWNGELAALQDLHAELRERAGDVLEIHLGGEIAVHFDSVEEIYEMPDGELPSLAGSRYVLLELDWHGLGPDVSELVHEVRVRELFPIIAHPERVAWLAKNRPLLESLVERGAALQLTAMSLTGELGGAMRDLSDDLIDAGLIHFVASDAHDLEIRPPGLQAAFARTRDVHGAAVAERLFATNPRAVLEDRPLPDIPS